MIEVIESTRTFTYNGVALPDPHPSWNADKVKEFYTSQHPELATATVTGPTTRDGRTEYAFTRAIGTKG